MNSQVAEFVKDKDWVIKPMPGLLLVMFTSLIFAVQYTADRRSTVLVNNASCAVGETYRDDGRIKLKLNCEVAGSRKEVQVWSSQQVVQIVNSRAARVNCTVYANTTADDCVAPATQN